MKTARFLKVIFGILFALTGVAALWLPKDGPRGKTPLIWSSDNNPARTAQIAAFNGENPELFLKLDYNNSGLQKLLLQCTSGVGPDIMDFTDEQVQTLVEAGILEDITEAAQARGFSAKDAWPAAAQVMTIEGRQYAYPCNTSASILIYNKNIFDYFGVPYPKDSLTWEEFFALAQKVNSPPDERSSRRIYAVSGLSWKTFFESLHGEFFAEDGRITIDTPELKQAFEMHRDILFKYQLMPTAVEAKSLSGQGGWGLGNLNQFAAGRFAMIVTGEWALIAFGHAYHQQMKALEAGGRQPAGAENPLQRPLRLGATLLPHFSGRPPSYRVTNRLAGINRNSARRQEALAFLQYLAGPDYSALINAEVDCLPGNPRYVDLGVMTGVDSLARLQMHRTTQEAVRYSYAWRISPFLALSDITRIQGGGVLDDKINRLESDPATSIDGLLKDAQLKLETLLRRNLGRDPKLQELYHRRFGEADASNGRLAR